MMLLLALTFTSSANGAIPGCTFACKLHALQIAAQMPWSDRTQLLCRETPDQCAAAAACQVSRSACSRMYRLFEWVVVLLLWQPEIQKLVQLEPQMASLGAGVYAADRDRRESKLAVQWLPYPWFCYVLLLHGAVRAQETWYALVANSEFMFNDVQNEALAEQLREKKRFYGEQVCAVAGRRGAIGRSGCGGLVTEAGQLNVSVL